MGIVIMAGEHDKNNQFSSIAVEMNFVDQDKVDKALVVQARIFEKTKVSMSIGEILIEMGALTPAARDEIIGMLNEIEAQRESAPPPTPLKKSAPARSAKKGSSTLDISVSKDKLTASAYFDGEVPATDFDINDVKTMLHAEGILHGIADDEQIRGFIDGQFCVGEQWTIATGTEPIPDTPPEIIYHFDTNPLKIGTLTENGLMDWKDRGTLPQVKEADLLAEKIPGPKGKEGMDVYGKKIPIPKTRELRFKCGKGARRSEDGLQVHATVSGIPKLSVVGEISVMSTLHIPGDISLETGHVTFDGHIEVTGAIEKGYRVKGESLRANEIRDAQIDVAGDITSMNGIFGATIRCGGNLRAGHIHNTNIILAGDIAVEKEIIESDIEANGRCLSNDGIIIASTISAKMGITAMDIGTRASNPSELIVGIDQQMEREIEATREKIQAIKAEHEGLPKLIKDLKKRSDQLNTSLGEVAQEQDRCMVQHRRLQEKIEAGLLKKVGSEAEKLQKTIDELKIKQEAYDSDIAKLMEEDESISQQIATSEKSAAENAKTLEELKTHLDQITENQKMDRGIAIVKVGGNIYSGNAITGPHCKMVLQEDLQRVSIAETDQPDHDGVKRWRFELNPYR
jgi:uncharacterized protein